MECPQNLAFSKKRFPRRSRMGPFLICPFAGGRVGAFLGNGYNALERGFAMKKCLILLAEGFEETEAIVVHDVLTRTAEAEVTLSSVSDQREVVSSMGLRVKADAVLSKINPADYSFVVLPGGKRGVANLHSSSTIAFLRAFHQARKPIYAICAAPSILGELGYLDGKKFTCFPGFQKGNGAYQDAGVVNDGGLITGRAMAYAVSFAEEIVLQEFGEAALAHIKPGMYGTMALTR